MWWARFESEEDWLRFEHEEEREEAGEPFVVVMGAL